jgi:hypothetical protein
MHLSTCSSSHCQRLSVLVTVRPMCSSAPRAVAVVGAGSFAGSLTPVMRSQLATCVDMPKFAGAKRLCSWLTTRGTSKLPERLYGMSKALMGQ